jgi:hypothetical protein
MNSSSSRSHFVIKITLISNETNVKTYWLGVDMVGSEDIKKSKADD